MIQNFNEFDSKLSQINLQICQRWNQGFLKICQFHFYLITSYIKGHNKKSDTFAFCSVKVNFNMRMIPMKQIIN